MENQNHAASGGLGLLEVLTIVFIVLKLCGLISWSWWLVLMPLWIELGVIVVLLIILVVISGDEDDFS